MRRNAIRSQPRPSSEPWATVLFLGGPLHGLRIRVAASSVRSASIGFATRISRGIVQALYEPGGGERWQFRDYMTPEAAWSNAR